ncbi:MAG: hypothetical protein IKS17_02825 [Firmicutes bacterium]|nr:hypothetical protein [Bacillota bacterium]
MDDFDGMLVFTLLVFILIWFFIAYILRGLKKYFTVMKNGKACRAKIDSPGSQIRGAYYPLITYKTKGGLKLKWYSKYGFTKRQLKKLQKSGIDIHYLEDEPLEFVIDKYDLYGHIASVLIWLLFFGPVVLLWIFDILGMA